MNKEFEELMSERPRSLADKLLWERQVNKMFKEREASLTANILSLQNEIEIYKEELFQKQSSGKPSHLENLKIITDKYIAVREALILEKERNKIILEVFSKTIDEFVQNWPRIVSAEKGLFTKKTKPRVYFNELLKNFINTNFPNLKQW